MSDATTTTSPTDSNAGGTTASGESGSGAAANGQQQTMQTATQAPVAGEAAQANGQQAGTLQLTQERLDQIIGDRLSRAEKTWQDKQAEERKKFAAALGIEDPNAKVDPAKALEEQQTRATAAEQRADRSEAKALALAAGIKAERVDRFVKLVDVTAALKDVDRSDDKAVTAALKKAVDETLTDVPEFKGSTVAASSGGDRSNASNGAVTLAAFKKMDERERTKLYQSDVALYRQLAAQEKG